MSLVSDLESAATSKLASVVPSSISSVLPSAISSALGKPTRPTKATAKIGSNKFNASGIHFEMATVKDGSIGMPVMGNITCSIIVKVDLNDQANLPFAVLQSLFELSSGASRDKIQDITLTFWSDDSTEDVICSYTFRGWISDYITSTGFNKTDKDKDQSYDNHTLTLVIEPELDATNAVKIVLGN